MNHAQHEIHALNAEQRNAFIATLDKAINLANSLKKLTSNPDFIALLGDERINSEVRRLTGLLRNAKTEEQRQGVTESLLFYSHLDYNFAYIIAEGEKAAYAKSEVNSIWSAVDNGTFDADSYFANDSSEEL